MFRIITGQEKYLPMETGVVIPDFQDVPFPAPLWLLKTLLIVGFYLHAIPMNILLGGTMISGLMILLGRENTYVRRFGHTFAMSMPFFISYAITQGVMPLLFLQLIYGPLFYTSSIAMAAPWISIIVLLLVAYYGVYFYRYRHVTLGKGGALVMIIAALLFLCVGFFFSNNMTLMLMPERWTPMIERSPYGFNLNWGAPQLLPRYLHIMMAAYAVTGLAIGCFGLYWRNRDPEYGKWLISKGAALYLIVTLGQFVVGTWFMLSLPHDIMMQFLGRDPAGTGVFVLSMIVDLIALVAMAMAWRDGSSGPFKIALAGALVVVFLMSYMRHLLREYYVAPFFDPGIHPVEPQWALLIMFGIGVILLIIYLIWLGRVTWQAFHPPQAASEVRTGT